MPASHSIAEVVWKVSPYAPHNVLIHLGLPPFLLGNAGQTGCKLYLPVAMAAVVRVGQDQVEQGQVLGAHLWGHKVYNMTSETYHRLGLL